MNRLSFFALACGAAALLLSGCGGGGSGIITPAAQSGAIVFTSTRDSIGGFYRMNADGSNQTRLTALPDGAASPHLSRDGKTIVFTRVVGQTPKIFTIQADGANYTQLTTDEGTSPTSDSNPTISPSEQAIAYSKDNNVWLMGISGQNQQFLSQTNSLYSAPTFSPNGTLLAYGGMRNSRNVLIVRILSTGTERIIDPTLPVLIQGDAIPQSPHFNPDGSRIIFSAPTRGGNHVFIVKIDGSDAKTPAVVPIDPTYGGTPSFIANPTEVA